MNEITPTTGDRDSRIRVAVVFGGVSSEHAVSCVTAQSVISAMDPEKYDVIPVGITKSGQWTLVPAGQTRFALDSGDSPEVSGAGTAVQLHTTADGQELMSVNEGDPVKSLGDVDVVFPLLHGPFGEDGTIQGMLEMAGVPYVGSGVLASAAGMDKHFMKVIFAAAGLRVGPYEVITDRDWEFDREGALGRAASLNFPLFVKPARAGSSMGITKVSEPGELANAVVHAREFDPKVIVEEGIAGREIEVGVLEAREQREPRTTLPGEIAVTSQDHDFYDFEAKYVEGNAADLSCPADLPEADIALVRELAARAFTALEAEGLSRVDFFYTPEGEFVINEINTMPGFTPISMYPQMWAKTGLPYEQLIDELVNLALSRRIGLR